MQDLLTITEAAELIPTHPHASALWRWARRGLKARNGATIHLGHVRCGGRIMIERSAIERFMRELAEADLLYFAASSTEADSPSLPVRTVTARDAEIVKTKPRLDAIGV